MSEYLYYDSNNKYGRVESDYLFITKSYLLNTFYSALTGRSLSIRIIKSFPSTYTIQEILYQLSLQGSWRFGALVWCNIGYLCCFTLNPQLSTCWTASLFFLIMERVWINISFNGIVRRSGRNNSNIRDLCYSPLTTFPGRLPFYQIKILIS